MRLFRIAKTPYIHDTTGTGARLYGGRWNEKGVGLIYTSESRALAALEFLVHIPMAIVPDDLSIVQYDIPTSILPETLDLSSLPKNWRAYPPPEVLALAGTHWIRSNASLLLQVPSAVVEHEFNVLINPAHPNFSAVEQSTTAAFVFDRRLLEAI